MHTRRQSTVTFEVFVLWLHNQCYYTHDVIRIKMIHRDLPYYEVMRAKTCCENKLHENKQNYANLLHTFRKWSVTWSQFVLSSPNKCCCEENQLLFFCCFIPSKPLLLQWLFNLPVVALWINFSGFSMLGQVGWLHKSIFVLKPINMHSSQQMQI